jgi:hypothetical protein
MNNHRITIQIIQKKTIQIIPKNSEGTSLLILLGQEEPGEVATALSALDAMNDLQNLPPSVLLAQLQEMLVEKTRGRMTY